MNNVNSENTQYFQRSIKLILYIYTRILFFFFFVVVLTQSVTSNAHRSIINCQLLQLFWCSWFVTSLRLNIDIDHKKSFTTQKKKKIGFVRRVFIFRAEREVNAKMFKNIRWTKNAFFYFFFIGERIQREKSIEIIRKRSKSKKGNKKQKNKIKDVIHCVYVTCGTRQIRECY